LIFLKDIFKGLAEIILTQKYPTYTKELSVTQKILCAVKGGIEIMERGIPFGGEIWESMGFVTSV
jgi:hypothetical protein